MHSLIIGQSLSGKSSLAKELGTELRLARHEVLAFNPTGERGYTRRDDWGRAGADWESDDADDFAEHVLERVERDPARVRFLIIDEAHEFFTRADCQHLWIGTRGRHYGLNVIAITQRGALISPTFRGQCATMYLFHLSLTDAKFIADELGRKGLADEVLDLKKAEFMKVAGDELTRHRLF